MKSSLPLLLLAYLVCVPVTLAEHMPATNQVDANGIRATYDVCINAAATAFTATQKCIENEYDYQDARLNRVYKKLMKQLSSPERSKLRIEERKWITYRDQQCSTNDDDSQGYRLASNDCSLEQTAKRATMLEARLSGK